MTKFGRSISRTRDSDSISFSSRAAGYCKTKLARKTRWRQNSLRVLQMRADIQHGARLQRLGRTAGIHQRESGRGVALGKVGIERDHAAKLRERALVIAPPQ